MCFVTVASAAFVLQYSGNPNHSNLLDAVAGPVALVLLLALALFNHAGHVRTAGFLTGWILTEFVLAINVGADIFTNGYTWADVPGWDFAGFFLLIVALSVGLWPAVISYVLFVLQLIAIIVLIPQQPSVYATDVAAQMGASGIPLAQAAGQVIADLLLRTLLLALFCVILGVVDHRVTDRNLHEIEEQRQLAFNHEAIAYARQVQLQEDQELQEWVQETISEMPAAWAREELYSPPPIPPQAKGKPVYYIIRELLARMGRRMYPGQKAVAGLLAWKMYLHQLPDLMKRKRLAQSRSEPVSSAQELFQLATIQGTPGSPEIQDVLIELNNVFTLLGNEADEVGKEIKAATGEFLSGNHRRRLRDTLVPAQFVAVVSAVNAMFADLEKQLDNPNRQR